MQTATTPSSQKPSYIKDIVLLFSIPIAISLLAAAAVYIPRAFAKPSYDFIYSYCPDYQCRDSYSVGSTGTVQYSNQTHDSEFYTQSSELRYFDTGSRSYRIISLSEARRLNLINSSKAPDGYSLVQDSNSGGGFLFGGSYDESWQLENGWKKLPVDLGSKQEYYDNDTRFLGWVKSDG